MASNAAASPAFSRATNRSSISRSTSVVTLEPLRRDRPSRAAVSCVSPHDDDAMEVAMPGPYFYFYLVVGFFTLGTAIKFAVRPTERTLSIVRPMCAATVFASIASFLTAIANGVFAISRQLERASDPAAMAAIRQHVLGGIAESLAVPVIGATVLTIAWILVAVGMRRQA
jgi:hypothetical protein